MESQTGESRVAMTDSPEEMGARLEARIEAAAAMFERAAALLEQRATSMTGEVSRIVAQVETSREVELQQKLEAAEQEIAELKTQLEAQLEVRAEAKAESKAEPKSARRTVPAATAQFLAKQGISMLEQVEAGALDAALTGLSLEQRLAVKAQLLRAGVVG